MADADLEEVRSNDVHTLHLTDTLQIRKARLAQLQQQGSGGAGRGSGGQQNQEEQAQKYACLMLMDSFNSNTHPENKKPAQASSIKSSSPKLQTVWAESASSKPHAQPMSRTD